jgi:hypothetical protein
VLILNIFRQVTQSLDIKLDIQYIQWVKPMGNNDQWATVRPMSNTFEPNWAKMMPMGNIEVNGQHFWPKARVCIDFILHSISANDRQ